MTRYRKKPVEVEAWQVGSDEPMPEWVQGAYNHEHKGMFVGGDWNDYVPMDSWVCRDEFGITYVVSDEFFNESHEVVNDAED